MLRESKLNFGCGTHCEIEIATRSRAVKMNYAKGSAGRDGNAENSPKLYEVGNPGQLVAYYRFVEKIINLLHSPRYALQFLRYGNPEHLETPNLRSITVTEVCGRVFAYDNVELLMNHLRVSGLPIAGFYCKVIALKNQEPSKRIFFIYFPDSRSNNCGTLLLYHVIEPILTPLHLPPTPTAHPPRHNSTAPSPISEIIGIVTCPKVFCGNREVTDKLAALLHAETGGNG
ncbi:hypothetical protein Trydic_g23311 [Trypoxylus dichotomus]